MASNFFDESKKNMVANNKVAIFAHIIPRNIFIFKNWFVFFDPVRNFPSSVRYFFPICSCHLKQKCQAIP